MAADVVALRCGGMLQGIEARKLYEMRQHIGTENPVISCAVVVNGRCGGTGRERIHNCITQEKNPLDSSRRVLSGRCAGSFPGKEGFSQSFNSAI